MDRNQIDAIEQLKKHQKQLDADGIMVGVSRQALDIALDALDEWNAEIQTIRVAAANGPKRFGMVAWVDARGGVHLDSQDNIKDACLVNADEATAHAINMHKHGEQDAAERLAQYFASMGMNTLAADIRLQAAHWPQPEKALQPTTEVK